MTLAVGKFASAVKRVVIDSAFNGVTRLSNSAYSAYNAVWVRVAQLGTQYLRRQAPQIAERQVSDERPSTPPPPLS